MVKWISHNKLFVFFAVHIDEHGTRVKDGMNCMIDNCQDVSALHC